MAVTITDADTYFTSFVLHNSEWVDADLGRKQLALNNAANQLYRIYRSYDETTKPLPDEAVFEQALWLLRIDDTIRKAEQGVASIYVSGISISVQKVNLSVAPEVLNILGRRVGRTVNNTRSRHYHCKGSNPYAIRQKVQVVVLFPTSLWNFRRTGPLPLKFH